MRTSLSADCLCVPFVVKNPLDKFVPWNRLTANEELRSNEDWKCFGYRNRSVSSACRLMMFLDGIIFQPPRWRDMPEEPLLLQSGQETIAVLYYPADSPVIATATAMGKTSALSAKLRDFQQRGFAVIGYDYQGYGASTGKPRQGTYRNIEAVYRFLTESEKSLLKNHSDGIFGRERCILLAGQPFSSWRPDSGSLSPPFSRSFSLLPTYLATASPTTSIFANASAHPDFPWRKDSVIPVRNSKNSSRQLPNPKLILSQKPDTSTSKTISENNTGRKSGVQQKSETVTCLALLSPDVYKRRPGFPSDPH